MIKEAIRKVVEGQSLTQEEAVQTMSEIMDGEATPSQVASFITALRMKGETVEEITGFVKVMREKSVKIKTNQARLIDTCGTGGDKLDTFNISTASAVVLAGAGAPVAKHGNRAASSNCGSADVLEALGVSLALDAEQIGRSIDSVNIGFMFAPSMHPAMKYAVGPRKEIGVRTVFNILGPMTNPADAKFQVIGVFSDKLCEPMANVLKNLGTERAMIVHGMDGLDEISTLGKTRISELKDGKIRGYIFDAEDIGVARADAGAIAGGADLQENAEILVKVLQGEKGPRRDIVCLNAGAALSVAGLAEDIKSGFALAEKTIDSGAALDALENFKRFTQECAAK
ncbi:MAG: anthranilate phosphoribosyltransferase [Armatimonadota bacterium]|nr:anthranilate phosphoribosyltransferase [Armatimonadota bacterium]